MATTQPAHNKHVILVIGIGNAYRRDDAAGLHVAQSLRKKVYDHVDVIEQSGDGATLLECWKNVDTVILIDAVSSGTQPGTIHRIDAHAAPIPSNFFHYSTHAFGVAEAIELARALNQVPQQLIIYGIEGKCFETGVALSTEVEKAARKVLTRVLQDIRNAARLQRS